MDTLEIIRQLQADSALRSELRAVLLGEEILTLPELVRENSRQIALLAESMKSHDQRLIHVENDVSVLKTDVSALRTDVSVLKTDVSALRTDVGAIKGKQLEDDLRLHPRAYVRRSHLSDLRSLTYDEKYVISESLDENERLDLDLADVVLKGARPDGAKAYVLAEASETLDLGDLNRAKRRAELLVKATGLPCLPLAVSGVQPRNEIVQLARELKVALSRKHYGIVVDAPYLEPNHST